MLCATNINNNIQQEGTKTKRNESVIRKRNVSENEVVINNIKNNSSSNNNSSNTNIHKNSSTIAKPCLCSSYVLS